MKTKILALSLVLIGMLTVISCTKEYTVTVNSNNETWGAVTGNGTYASGATATLAAVPATNCFFVKWNDEVTDNPRIITVTKVVTYTAYFAENNGDNFTVTVNSNNEAWGSATGSGIYAAGATATLAAVPATNCFFVKWNDEVTDNPRTITVTEDITYTAYFAENAGGTFSFSGKVQKGPFVTGTTITVNELNEGLGQTGKSFTTSISSDDGSFSLSNLEMESDLALLSGNGFYFNEVLGQLSSAQITLQAITELTNEKTVNINVLTHLTKARIETLVGEGMSFADAKRKAEGEFQDFLGVTEHFNQGFEQMSIASQGDFNAMLLAFSVILQRPTHLMNAIPTLPAELTWLMTSLSTDFADNGAIDNEALVDTLIYNISVQDQVFIRSHIQNYYSGLGLDVEIPDFESYIRLFQAAHQELVTEFIYPDEASPAPEMGPDGEVPNLLVKDITQFDGDLSYVVAAITPLGKSLKVKITGNLQLDLNNGWLITDYSHGCFTLEAQRQNELVSMLVYFLDDSKNGSGTIEYYEDSDTPTFTKQITWTGGYPDFK